MASSIRTVSVALALVLAPSGAQLTSSPWTDGYEMAFPYNSDWGNYGDWGEYQYCPLGELVAGLRLKVEADMGTSGDDSAANVLELRCQSPWDPTGSYTEGVVQPALGDYGDWGTWSEWVMCAKGWYLDRLEIRVVDEQGAVFFFNGDDYALTSVRFVCNTPEAEPSIYLEHEPSNGIPNGEWALPVDACRDRIGGEAYACGARVKVEERVDSSDDTAMNEISMQCCRYTDSVPAGYNYVGCYPNVIPSSKPGSLQDSDKMSPEWCLGYCGWLGAQHDTTFPYVGVHNGRYCACIADASKVEGSPSEDQCIIDCVGDHSLFCGGPLYGHTNVYRVGSLDGTQLRLADGPFGTPWAGRLEVLYDGQWGTVCNDHFGDKEAAMVCAALGFGSGAAKLYNGNGSPRVSASEASDGSTLTPPGQDPIWLDDVFCGGYERSLAECQHDGWGIHDNCGHHEDVAIECVPRDGELRLVPVGDPAPQPWAGRLEVFHEGEWGTVCNNGFGHLEALVACKQLGYPGYTTLFNEDFNTGYGQGFGRIWLENLDCDSDEVWLPNCDGNAWGDTDCAHYEDVGLGCTLVPYAYTLRMSLADVSYAGGSTIQFTVWGDNGKSTSGTWDVSGVQPGDQVAPITVADGAGTAPTKVTSVAVWTEDGDVCFDTGSLVVTLDNGAGGGMFWADPDLGSNTDVTCADGNDGGYVCDGDVPAGQTCAYFGDAVHGHLSMRDGVPYAYTLRMSLADISWADGSTVQFTVWGDNGQGTSGTWDVSGVPPGDQVAPITVAGNAGTAPTKVTSVAVWLGSTNGVCFVTGSLAVDLVLSGSLAGQFYADPDLGSNTDVTCVDGDEGGYDCTGDVQPGKTCAYFGDMTHGHLSLHGVKPYTYTLRMSLADISWAGGSTIQFTVGADNGQRTSGTWDLSGVAPGDQVAAITVADRAGTAPTKVTSVWVWTESTNGVCFDTGSLTVDLAIDGAAAGQFWADPGLYVNLDVTCVDGDEGLYDCNQVVAAGQDCAYFGDGAHGHLSLREVSAGALGAADGQAPAAAAESGGTDPAPIIAGVAGAAALVAGVLCVVVAMRRKGGREEQEAAADMATARDSEAQPSLPRERAPSVSGESSGGEEAEEEEDEDEAEAEQEQQQEPEQQQAELELEVQVDVSPSSQTDQGA